MTTGFELVFTRRFSMAHRLIAGCSDKCATPHGHNEDVTIRLAPIAVTPLDHHINMVEEFASAKGRWHQWIDNHVDHAFQLSNTDPIIEWFKQQEPERVSRLLVTPGDPTTEMLCVVFMSKLNAILQSQNSRLRCIEVEIAETPTNKVRFSGNPIANLPQTPNAWYLRPDDSINDLEVD